MSGGPDLPEFQPGVTIVQERCRYISASERWYTLTYERPYYPDIPSRCTLFPSVLTEVEIHKGKDYFLRAEYPNGERELFSSFEELAFRFSARQLSMVSDPVSIGSN